MKQRSISILMLAFAVLLLAQCTKDEVELPELGTLTLNKLKTDSIEVSGNITSDGGAEITAKGICWSFQSNPDLNSNVISAGAGTSAFSGIISGFPIDTTIYIRGYASNSAGTAYSQEVAYNSSLTKEELFEQMLTWMCGSFSSENHADTTVNQYIVDVRLHMAQIWVDRNQGENIYWLYVEQAYASNLNSPYRQRIYKMMLDANGNIYDEVYAIPNAASYLHSYQSPSDFDNLNESDLTKKDGCDVFFNWAGDHYEGATSGTGCASVGIPGVAYITSEATIFPDHMTSWDLGYAANGAWVMGPDWPYIFDKLENYGFVGR